MSEWSRRHGIYDHLIRANELKLHIHRIITNMRLGYYSHDQMSLHDDMAIHNMHLNLARNMQGDGAVFSLNAMEMRCGPMKIRILTAVDDKGITFLSDPVGVVKHIETFVPWSNISQVDLIRPVAGIPCEVCGEPIGENDFVTANHAWHREDCGREVRAGDIIRVGVKQRFRNDWYGDFFPFPDSEWIVSSVSNDVYPLTLQHPTSHQLYKYLPSGDSPYTIVKRAEQHAHGVPWDAKYYVAKQPEVAPVGDVNVGDFIKGSQQDISGFVMSVGYEDILVRVDEDTLKRTGTRVWKLNHGDYTIVERATDKGDKCEGEAAEPTTAELVDMLSKREGVSETSAEPYRAYSISVGGDEFGGTGPARILVVTD